MACGGEDAGEEPRAEIASMGKYFTRAIRGYGSRKSFFGSEAGDWKRKKKGKMGVGI